MASITSATFTDSKGFAAAAQDIREQAMAALGKSGTRVRFSRDCWLLQTFMPTGTWVNHTAGLTESRDAVTGYKGTKEHRLVIRF